MRVDLESLDAPGQPCSLLRINRSRKRRDATRHDRWTERRRTSAKGKPWGKESLVWRRTKVKKNKAAVEKKSEQGKRERWGRVEEEGEKGKKERGGEREGTECGRENCGLVFQTATERKTCGLDRRSCATIPTEIRYQQLFSRQPSTFHESRNNLAEGRRRSRNTFAKWEIVFVDGRKLYWV